ncbi:MAG TPA: GGDEF domain-containing protein [Gammaproteobacteria bacterium]
MLTLTLASIAVAEGLALALWLLVPGLPLWPLLALAFACAVVVAPLVAWPLMHMLADLEAKRAHLDVLATRDELTGVHNRRQFLVLADREWSRCRRYDTGAAVLMIDVDHFKAINDRHGHLAGDVMLREIARVAGETLRRPDLFGRFGGEEFVVFLPHADALGALDVAERIRARVAELALEWKDHLMRSTVSIGVATLDNVHESFAALLQDADLALYAAKGAGRNCVRTVPPPPARRHGTSTSISSPR